MTAVTRSLHGSKPFSPSVKAEDWRLNRKQRREGSKKEGELQGEVAVSPNRSPFGATWHCHRHRAVLNSTPFFFPWPIFSLPYYPPLPLTQFLWREGQAVVEVAIPLQKVNADGLVPLWTLCRFLSSCPREGAPLSLPLSRHLPYNAEQLSPTTIHLFSARRCSR